MTMTQDRRARTPQVLPVSPDARERLVAFYRERDEADERRFVAGHQKVRGKTYALGLARLASGEDVYESYGVVSAAGVELTPSAQRLVESLPQDWSRVVRVDAEGQFWTASLRAKGTRIR